MSFTIVENLAELRLLQSAGTPSPKPLFPCVRYASRPAVSKLGDETLNFRANMPATVIPAGELSPDLLHRWLLISRENPLYSSPNLRPEVIRTIGQFNPRVFVGFEQAR